MNINDLRAQIETSFATCRQCGEVIDSWPAAEPGEASGRDHPVAYYPRTATFSGMCSQGHINEFYLAEVKALEIAAHDITERTCGEFVSQKDCKHQNQQSIRMSADQAVPTEDGVIEGPCLVAMCTACGRREKVKPQQVKAPWKGLIGIDGKPIRRREDE